MLPFPLCFLFWWDACIILEVCLMMGGGAAGLGGAVGLWEDSEGLVADSEYIALGKSRTHCLILPVP
jgi:hypothetical protein